MKEKEEMEVNKPVPGSKFFIIIIYTRNYETMKQQDLYSDVNASIITLIHH